MRAGGPLPFVGRAREHDIVRGRATAFTDDVRRVQLIRGAAGVGKTRLVGEALTGLARRVVWVRCWDDSQALWPWRRVLEQLGRPCGEFASSDRLHVFGDLLEGLRSAAPAIVVLDDLHLSDDQTILFTQFLARAEPPVDVLVIATARPASDLDDDRAMALAELTRDADELLLRSLGPADARQLFESSGARITDPSLIDALITLTKGLPLAIERTAMAIDSAEPTGGDVLGTVNRAGHALTDDVRHLLGMAAVYGPTISIRELRDVSGCSEAEALEVMHQGSTTGLLEPITRAEIVFTHDLIREAIAAWLLPGERADVHRAAVLNMVGTGPFRLPLAADHAVAVAMIDRSFTAEALRLLIAAAEHHRSVGAFESALGCHDSAAALAAAAGARLAVGQLLSHADAALTAGRLAHARELFGVAASAATEEGDDLAFADAALGLSGLWLGEQRDEQQALAERALQRRALAAVEPIDERRALRLRVRLAGEAAYESRAVTDLDELDRLVEQVRATGSPRDVAEALSVLIHAKLAPEFRAEIIRLADELIAAAADVSDPMTSLRAQCWRTVALQLANDDRAPRARRSLELRSYTLRCAGIQFIVDAMAVGDLISAGRFAEAETAAEHCFALGRSVGDADAWNYFAGHLATIRYFQGRHIELADFAHDASLAPTNTASERALATAAAWFAASAGDSLPAQQIVEIHRRRPEPSSYQPSTWLVAMHALARIAIDLRDPALGADVAAQLMPYRALSSALSMAVADLGPVDWTIALALTAAGDLDGALDAAQRALDQARKKGVSPAVVIISADQAVVLQLLGRADVARPLLDAAIDEARRRDMSGWVQAWTLLRAAWSADAPIDDAPRFRRLDRRTWECRWAGHSANVPHSVGVQYLALLCASPDTEFAASRLAYLSEPSGDRHEVVDAATLASLRRRATELSRQIEFGEGDRRAAEDELDAVNAALLSSLGLGTRRAFADAGERARTSVRKAITRGIAAISAAAPDIAGHLTRHVRTGQHCSYSSAEP